MNEIVELIESRIEWSYERNINKDGLNAPLEMTIEYSQVGSKFTSKYLDVSQDKPFNINSFEMLGWNDPFPDKD